ncbi:PQQ-binding-like beta-propeller repeat protein [Actinoplanes sp. NPDC023936]|uniref:outer membrane protein assembly factor BamB family protein n=1 Tax=Actinoplanes sp. NPDC023936 TaxID=3154910 RepID=UPI0033F7FD2D
MALIELGDVAAAGPPDPAADRITAGFDRRRSRPIALLAVLIVALACGGAVRPQPAGPRVLWTAPRTVEQGVVLAEDAVYVLTGGDRAEVIAYSIADGRRLWRWGTDAHLITIFPAPGGGPLLVVADPVAAGNPDGPAAKAARTTVALRPGSGAELWRRPGEPHLEAVERATAMLMEFDPRGGVGALTRIRLEDGVPIWRNGDREPVQEVVVETRDDRPHRVITATVAGDVTVRGYDDGARQVTRRLPPARYSARNSRLFGIAFDGERESTTVYRLDTLDELLRSETITDCGGVICAFGRSGLAALDPADGRELWRGPEIFGSVMTNDRILTEHRDGAEHVLLESRTGRPLSGTVHGYIARAQRWRDEVLLLRPTSDPIGRTAVTRLDLRTGRTSLLGSLEPMPDQQSCLTTPGYLMCTGWDRIVVASVPR